MQAGHGRRALSGLRATVGRAHRTTLIPMKRGGERCTETAAPAETAIRTLPCTACAAVGCHGGARSNWKQSVAYCRVLQNGENATKWSHALPVQRSDVSDRNSPR